MVPIEQLQTGDVALVRAGEKIPVDGSIIGGAASINEAPITGESVVYIITGDVRTIVTLLILPRLPNWDWRHH